MDKNFTTYMKSMQEPPAAGSHNRAGAGH
eukprot:COSAG04_NODE_20168_length_399_cov_0.693333_1_plen_28_part_10